LEQARIVLHSRLYPQLPFTVVVEFLKSQEFVVWDEDALLQRQRERIAAVEVTTIGGDDVMTLIAGDIQVPP
jgi:hypothetical protein